MTATKNSSATLVVAALAFAITIFAAFSAVFAVKTHDRSTAVAQAGRMHVHLVYVGRVPDRQVAKK